MVLRTGSTVLVALGAALALGIGMLVRPVPGPLPQHVAGDADLADLAREVVGPDRPALAVAAVTPTSTRTAVVGAAADARFEIGSITKGLTGLLFADMVARGEVTPTTTVGALLPVSGPVADVTLEQLATHRSGLPVVRPGFGQVARDWWSSLTAGNPYPGSAADVVAAVDGWPDGALDAPPGTYSNLGFALLGAALARTAGVPYRALLTERVLAPLDMAATTVPYAAGDLGPRDVAGKTRGGRRADPWLGEGIAPAGGVRSDVADMARLAHALLVGEASGLDALRPRAALDSDGVGWAWITSVDPTTGRSVVWHNGGTGGFTAFLGVDRAAGVGVVVLSAVGEPPEHVTGAGFALLDRLAGAR